jgi:hypothetical protein
MQKSAFSPERAFFDRESGALQNNKHNQQTLDQDKRWDWSNFLFAWGIALTWPTILRDGPKIASTLLDCLE